MIAGDLWIVHADSEQCAIGRAHRIRECCLCVGAQDPEAILGMFRPPPSGVKFTIGSEIRTRREIAWDRGIRPVVRPPSVPRANLSEPTCSLASVSPPWQWTWTESFVPFSQMLEVDPGWSPAVVWKHA